jgi:hypothetical protein
MMHPVRKLLKVSNLLLLVSRERIRAKYGRMAD